MGREIRRVPPNWEHPKDENFNDGRYQPMHETSFEKRKNEWIAEFLAWENKTHSSYDPEYTYWEWSGNPPDRTYYVPYKPEEATWFQVYETVSEGTPVSPPFETEEELIKYLATYGDFWDQKRGAGPWNIESAAQFVKGDGWRPTGVITGGKFYKARDM